MAQLTSYFTTMIGMPRADPGFSRGCDIAHVSCHHFGAFYAHIYFLKNEKIHSVKARHKRNSRLWRKMIEMIETFWNNRSRKIKVIWNILH